MKKKLKLLILAVFLAAVTACLLLPASAAEEYSYTVTVSAGGLEEAALNAGAVSGYSASAEGGRLVIRGVPYGAEINLSGAVSTGADSKYTVRGYVRSGRDYNEAVNVVSVTGDTDLVAAYSIPGRQVAYQVNYVDGDGNALAESQTFYGTIGDKPVATYVYVEGYLPQALNLTKTLSENEAENVFTFVYTPVAQEIVTAAEAETPVVEGEAAEGAAGAEAAAGEEAAAEEPAEPQELIDLDEEEVPLAQASDVLGEDGEDGGTGAAGMNKGAVIGGSIAAAVVVIGLAAVLAVTKKKKKANT